MSGCIALRQRVGQTQYVAFGDAVFHFDHPLPRDETSHNYQLSSSSDSSHNQQYYAHLLSRRKAGDQANYRNPCLAIITIFTLMYGNASAYISSVDLRVATFRSSESGE